MSETLIREVAQQIIKEQFLENWKFYMLILGLWTIGLVVALMVSYMKKRGENLATKADFEELLQQIRATTKTTEEVKTAIAHADWNTKEWKTLRRMKLEDLIESIYSVNQWISDDTKQRLIFGGQNGDVNPIFKVKMITDLYFPELQVEVVGFLAVFYEYDHWKASTHVKLLETKLDPFRHSEVQKTIVPGIELHSNNLLVATKAIEAKAPIIMKEITGTPVL